VVTPDDMRAGRLLTGLVIAGWLLAGLIPRYTRTIRIGVLASYLVGIAAFITWVLVR
jgi:hypothetical protein